MTNVSGSAPSGGCPQRTGSTTKSASAAVLLLNTPAVALNQCVKDAPSCGSAKQSNTGVKVGDGVAVVVGVGDACEVTRPHRKEKASAPATATARTPIERTARLPLR